jgi:hypothetical protein
MPRKKCALCSHWGSDYRSLSSSSYEWSHQYLRSNGTVFDQDDLHLCSLCIRTFYSIKETIVPSSTTELMDTTEQANANVDDDRLTLNNVIFAGSGHSKCVICRQETRRGMIVMPKTARLDLLIIHLMYAPNGVRCCSSHLLNNNRLIPDVEIIMENRQQLASSLSSSEMIDLVTDLLSLLHEAVTSPRLDFLDPSLNDEDYLAWTGWTKV